MSEDDFAWAKESCQLEGAAFESGSFVTGRSATIVAPSKTIPSDWDGKLTCIAELFGGDGVTKPARVSFKIRFDV
ncbi:MAG: hypothetical protein ABJL11_04935 [Parasphingorhabdus sp.]